LRRSTLNPLVGGLILMIGLRDDTGSAPPPTSHAPTLAAKIFAEDGWLQTGLTLDHRPQQEAMARAVAKPTTPAPITTQSAVSM